MKSSNLIFLISLTDIVLKNLKKEPLIPDTVIFQYWELHWNVVLTLNRHSTGYSNKKQALPRLSLKRRCNQQFIYFAAELYPSHFIKQDLIFRIYKSCLITPDDFPFTMM